MTRLILALCLAVGLTAPAQAQSDPSDVESVIRSQIDAFLQDDFETAFTFASPGIKRLFGTPENFGRMVQQGYPMVWRPAEVTFLGRETAGGTVLQRVQIVDSGGTVHTLLYQLTPGGAGWQINGVQILDAAQLGA
jgi:hypothetical protein